MSKALLRKGCFCSAAAAGWASSKRGAVEVLDERLMVGEEVRLGCKALTKPTLQKQLDVPN